VRVFGAVRTLVLGPGLPALEGMVRLLERVDRGSRRLLTILTYHRIDEPHAQPHLDPALISAAPREFERQVRWLAANARPLSLAELLDLRRARARPPPRAVLVTFDDAYRDFAEHAWPPLRAHGVPATLFVPTAYPGSAGAGFWWDRLHGALSRTRRRDAIATSAGYLPLATHEDRARAHRVLSKWVARTPHDDAMAEVQRVVAAVGGAVSDSPILGWDDLRRLAGEGVTLAPHSRTHPRLDRLALERAREEIAGSRDDLARQIGRCPPAFAFPGGGHDGRLRALLAEEGFELAFTTCRGANDLARPDWLALRRTNVGRAGTLPVIRAQLLSWPARATTVVARASP
jgi:peptidoglycan/xylan/chitin deacetylase (PgdA/CDA1 family)